MLLAFFIGVQMSLTLVIAVYLVKESQKPPISLPNGAFLLRHTDLYRRLAFASLLIVPVVPLILTYATSPEDIDTPFYIFASSMTCAVLLICLYFIWEGTKFSLIVSDKGLDCKSPWVAKRCRFIAWSDIQELKYDKDNSYFTIIAKDKGKFHVFRYISGINQFLEGCDRHLPPETIEKAKADYLKCIRMLQKVTGI